MFVMILSHVLGLFTSLYIFVQHKGDVIVIEDEPEQKPEPTSVLLIKPVGQVNLGFRCMATLTTSGLRLCVVLKN